MVNVIRARILLVLAFAMGLLYVSASHSQNVISVLPGTVVLLSQGPPNSGGVPAAPGSDIFSPAVYADYKRFGGEPTVVVDRYPFTKAHPLLQPVPCAAGQIPPCFQSSAPMTPADITYVCAPQGFGFPHYSDFWKSSDIGKTFRVPEHIPAFGETVANTGGGGDCHIAVGTITHNVFFVDLPGPGCVTMNSSTNFGENWTSDPLGCGLDEGTIDDRQWVDTDETFPNSNGGNVYVSFVNITNLAMPTLSLALSTHDGAPGSFATDSVCNTLVNAVTDPLGASDSTPTLCPDPNDAILGRAGPVVADKSPTSPLFHNVYIPFIRHATDASGNALFSLVVARSTDGAQHWTRQTAVFLPTNDDPRNLFVQMTIDKGGNLYLIWSETLNSSATGEQDIFYTFSADGGSTWASRINLTTGNSAIMPWIVAGDAGRVDVVFYQGNTNLNSNTTPNPTVWNVFFGRSNSANTTSPSFTIEQISDHPNHIGQICTAGLGCTTGGNRNLLDFFTIDIDHLGAANVVWADDNNSRNDTINRFSRQLSGNSVFASQTINLLNNWPLHFNATGDPEGDVFDGAGFPVGRCPGMDLETVAVNRAKGGVIHVLLYLNAASTAANARACSTAGTATGGVWGVEFWAATANGSSDNFYVAYRDNPPDGAPRVEAGNVQNLNVTITSLEFHPLAFPLAAVGGTCFPSSGPATSDCHITLTFNESDLNLQPGTTLISVTGLSTYMFGTASRPPLLRIEGGNSEQGDAATPFDVI